MISAKAKGRQLKLFQATVGALMPEKMQIYFIQNCLILQLQPSSQTQAF
ncbi:hypothetical protein COO91_01986 [Nostoc flagelliforme CCNUN1]|uniref:Uncharacterized protein n=1 Tax=Nostoc flagelliforme CCNUN1 TaxID=2038116 RepID=A0A2K8SL01_9NOSO|nr:hypothetical protein COO91_01986 [Nostoc flagelliforme CCNUN1]